MDDSVLHCVLHSALAIGLRAAVVLTGVPMEVILLVVLALLRCRVYRKLAAHNRNTACLCCVNLEFIDDNIRLQFHERLVHYPSSFIAFG